MPPKSKSSASSKVRPNQSVANRESGEVKKKSQPDTTRSKTPKSVTISESVTVTRTKTINYA